MSRRKRGRNVHGVVLLDKPEGMSSNRALQAVRRLFDARKAGHTGSLDPFATGMLPLCFGEASKTAAFMLDADKTYRATALLGASTVTGDTEGEVVNTCAVPECDAREIESVLRGFEGEISQVPPMYSALKHQGRPLYELARKGVEVERKARRVVIHRLVLLRWEPPELEFEVRCSKGTYVRTLAEDIGAVLGSCAHLVALRRLDVVPFDASSMVSLEDLEAAQACGSLSDFLLPVDAGLPHWPVLVLNETEAGKFSHGNRQEVVGAPSGPVRVHACDGRVLGLADVDDGGIVKPRRVFNIDKGPQGADLAEIYDK